MKKVLFIVLFYVVLLAQNPYDGIFISEYVEGASYDKAIEIFNGCYAGTAINLSRLRLRLYINGNSTPSNTITFSLADDNTTSTIPHLGCFVVYNSSYSNVSTNMPNCPTSKRKSNGSINHNGDDAYDLQYDATGSGDWVTIDIFGKIGEDPGSSWSGGGLSTSDYALQRKSAINDGVKTNPTSFDPSLEYTGSVFSASGPLTTLGQHTCSNPLPVELSVFSANVKERKVELNWQTATELNNKGFEIERNTGNGWQNIGFVAGKGTSNTVNNYSFTDNSTLYGKVTYRLKQVDNDGKFTYSKEVEVDLGLPKSIELLANYPNPFNPTTTINFVIPQAGNVDVKVYNSLGAEVATLFNGKMDAGMQQLQFDASNLTSGVYYYTVSTDFGVKTAKMMLMK